MAEGTGVSQLIETVTGMKQQQETQQQNQQNQQQILEDIVQQLRNMSARMDQMTKAQGKRLMGSPHNSPTRSVNRNPRYEVVPQERIQQVQLKSIQLGFPGLMEMILSVGYTRPINSLTFTTPQPNTCYL
jgi:hypothetical protein